MTQPWFNTRQEAIDKGFSVEQLNSECKGQYGQCYFCQDSFYWKAFADMIYERHKGGGWGLKVICQECWNQTSLGGIEEAIHAIMARRIIDKCESEEETKKMEIALIEEARRVKHN